MNFVKQYLFQYHVRYLKPILTYFTQNCTIFFQYFVTVSLDRHSNVKDLSFFFDGVINLPQLQIEFLG